jgi:methionyl-tRNA synthetase
MVLAASNEDHTKVELVDPSEGSKIGERVVVEGFPGDPEKVLKKETLDAVFPV